MESLLGEVGAGGRFQVQLVASFKFADMSLAWGMMQMTFAGLVPDWWCQPPEAANSSHGNWSRDNTTFHICPVSNNSDTCGEVVFDESVQTIVNELVSAIPGWNIGVCLFALMAWLFPNWSHLHMAVAALNLPFLLNWFVFPESARWLAVKGRLQEAEAVISHLARVNRRQKPKDTLERLQEVMEEERRAGQGRRYTYIDVYRGWRMAVTSLAINFIWFCLSFCYYGISFGVSALSGNLYLNIALMVLVEIPANFACVFFADRFGRKWTTFFLAILSSLSSFGILISNFKAPTTQQETITTTLAMISRLSVGAGWTVMNTFTLEQYPTVIRNLGIGAANTVARVGGVLAPIVLNMDTDQEVVHGYIVVGILMGVSAFTLLLLKETKGQDLRDSMTSVEVNNRIVNEPSGRTSSLDAVVPPMTEEPSWSSSRTDAASAVISRTGEPAKPLTPTSYEAKEEVEVKVEY